MGQKGIFGFRAIPETERYLITAFAASKPQDVRVFNILLSIPLHCKRKDEK
jgi:hypothetical protein